MKTNMIFLKAMHRKIHIALVVGVILASVFVVPAHAASFTVDSAADAVDAAPGNGVCATAGGVCTLRAAIQEANALAGDDIITVPAGTYTLTIAGTDEDVAATGDLDITSNITINGAGAGSTIIQAGTLGVGGPPNGIDRVFHVTGAFTVNISGVTVRNGNTGTDGGGIYNAGALTITNSTFSGNSTSTTADGGHGGGIYSNGTLSVADSLFAGNLANNGNGGGIHNSGTLTVTHSTFYSNTTHWSGGGIFNDSGTASVVNSAFTDNLAGYYGGGMYNGPSSSPTLTNITFSGNTAGKGGGMYNHNGTPTLTNVTFSGNTAGSGGGMYNIYSNPTLTNVTFSGNSASQNGGGMYNYWSDPQIHNTIFWGNTAPSGGAQIHNGDGSFPVVSDSVVQGGCPAESTCTNIITATPLLGTLGNYGGLTQTIPLLPGSSAINVGSGTYCTTGSDQRGVGYVGTCDIGAFESQGFTLTKSGGDSQSTLINTAFTNPLELNVTANGAGEPVNGGTITFTAPVSGASATLTGSPATISGGAVSVNATANGTFGTYQVTASANGAAINAGFDLENTQNEYTLTITSAHGTVAMNPNQVTYHEGDVVQLTATSNAGWSFANWTGGLTGSTNPDTVTIHGNTSVTANYIQNGYTLTITSAHGTVAKSPNQAIYHEGDVVQLTATPNAGWNFANWTGDLTGSVNPGSVTIHGDTSVTANYIQNEHTLFLPLILR